MIVILLILVILVSVLAGVLWLGFADAEARRASEQWLREEGYLPPTPEQIRREAMEEGLQKLTRGGDSIL